MEQVMFPFVPIVFIPLVYGFRTIGRQGLLNISILLVSGLIAYRLAVIYYGSEIFMKRVAQIEQLIEVARQKGGSKFVVSPDVIDHGYTQLNWSYPIETMLLSAIDGNDIVVTISPENDLDKNDIKSKIKSGQFLFRSGELKGQDWLNEKYFHLDIGPYRSLNDSTANTNMNALTGNLRIAINSSQIYQSMDTVWVPVSVLNLGNIPLYSGKNNRVYFSYFWLDEKKEVLNWNEIRTPLQADIIKSMSQHIRVAVPSRKGRLQLKVDLIVNDKWLGIRSQDEIMVY